MRRAVALACLASLLAGAGALIGVELSRGALRYGSDTVANPCEPRPPFPGTGLDATIQRVVLDGLDGAACELGTTREQLVLSLEPRTGEHIPWTTETIERAVRAGLLAAIDDAQARGSIPGFLATVMREIVERAPLRWLIEGGEGIASLLD